MFSLPPGTWSKVLEKAGDLTAQWGLTAWQLKSLEHKCSPTLSCESATINISCPEVGVAAPCDCSYYIRVNQLLWAVVCTVTLIACLLGGCLVILVCCRGQRRGEATGSQTAKAQAIALRNKYGGAQ